jgi:hypothetical protein
MLNVKLQTAHNTPKKGVTGLLVGDISRGDLIQTRP